MSGRSERTVGVVVDPVSEVYKRRCVGHQAASRCVRQRRYDVRQAFATIEDKMLILLDIDRLIGNSIDELLPASAAA